MVDIHNRHRPRKTALIELNQAAFGVYAQEDWVFIAGPGDGLVIADVQDPTSPKVVGVYAGSGINEICVHDQIAFAGTQQGDLYLIDVENPDKHLSWARRHGVDGRLFSGQGLFLPFR